MQEPQQQQYNYLPPPPYQQPNKQPYQQTNQQQPYGQPQTYGDPQAGNYAMNPDAENGQANAPQKSGRWNDVWATVLWVCNLAAFIAVSVLSLPTYTSNKGSTGGVPSNNPYSAITFDSDTVKIFGLATLVGFGLSLLYLLLINRFPRLAIIVTFICSIIVYFGVTIYYFVQHYYSAAIVFLIFSCLYLLCFWWWRSRIPFATAMLEEISTNTRKYPSTIVVGLVSLVVQTAFSIWFMLTVVGAYETYYSSSSNNSSIDVLMVFLVFSFYWTSQVISYFTHVVIAGIFASIYFLDTRVANPVWGSLKRASTTSFGSICFGSLLIAIVNMIRYFLSIAQANSDSAILSFVLCIIQCIVGCFQSLFEWFTYYAFSGVAIYGRPFIASAKRTWTMVKDRGIEAMINDNLIGNVLFMGGLTVGVLSSLFGFIYLKVANPPYNQTGNMTAVVVLVCFLIGAAMFSSIATVISSGVATTFVCLAEDPEALKRSKPELYEKIRQTWPRIEQNI